MPLILCHIISLWKLPSFNVCCSCKIKIKSKGNDPLILMVLSILFYSIHVDLHYIGGGGWVDCGQPNNYGHVICFRKLLPYLDQPTRAGTAQEHAVNTHPTEAWLALNLKLPMGLQTTMYLSIPGRPETTKRLDLWRKTEKPQKLLHLLRTFQRSVGTRSFIGLSKFTSKGSHESFNGAAHTSHSKTSHHARVDSVCESKADHNEPSQSSSPG